MFDSQPESSKIKEAMIGESNIMPRSHPKKGTKQLKDELLYGRDLSKKGRRQSQCPFERATGALQ